MRLCGGGNTTSTANSSSGNKKELSSKQRQAALLLASGMTHEKAAKEISCNEKTLYNWKKQQAFLDEIEQAEDAIYKDALKLLKRSTRAAITTLIACLDGKISAYSRIAAASKLLDASFEENTARKLEREIAELRADLEKGDGA